MVPYREANSLSSEMEKDVKFEVSLQVVGDPPPAFVPVRSLGCVCRFVANFCRRVERALRSESVRTKS